jgi:hypothetical protein
MLNGGIQPGGGISATAAEEGAKGNQHHLLRLLNFNNGFSHLVHGAASSAATDGLRPFGRGVT